MEKENLSEEFAGEVAGGKTDLKPFKIGDPVVERVDFCSKCGKQFKAKTLPWSPLGMKMCKECLKK